MNYLDIALQGNDESIHRLRDFSGQKIVLYFYPKDNTEGCTIEAKDFTAFKADFRKKGYIIIGVSADSVQSHQNFCTSQQLDLLLLADPNQELIKAFDVFREKSMYGRTFMGIERSTFLLDETGTIVNSLRKVSAKNHASSLLESL